MQAEDFILVDEFCASHHLKVSFIQALKEHGMIETVIVGQAVCVSSEELPRLERIVRLYRELEINLEGIEVVDNLLHRMEEMQHEIIRLKKKLDFFQGTATNDEQEIQ